MHKYLHLVEFVKKLM